MSVKILSASVVAAALAVGVQAQAQQQPPAQQPPSSHMDKAITIVGCVAKQSDVLEGAMSTPANPAMGDEFVLTHASLKSSDSPSTASEAKSPAAGMQNTFGKVYRATGDKEESLKTYVGQRVQVTGTFKDSEDATRELGATGTSGSSAAAKPTVANSPEFTIQSVTPTSGSCTPAK